VALATAHAKQLASTSATAAAAPPPKPACRLVSYFDADGVKHFRQECP
jgi:hypothetical protein